MLRSRHVLVAGSNSSTVVSERCARAGWMLCSLDPGNMLAPPITYSLLLTAAATAAPRLVGIGASAFHVSAAGSYSYALSTGCHAAGPWAGNTNPPNA